MPDQTYERLSRSSQPTPADVRRASFPTPEPSRLTIQPRTTLSRWILPQSPLLGWDHRRSNNRATFRLKCNANRSSPFAKSARVIS